MTSIASTIGSVSALSRGIGSLAATLSGNSFEQSLQTASYGGVPFAVEEMTTAGGRRVSVHTYPYRDEVWIEEMGKLARTFMIEGFLIENSAIYGGGGVVDQRRRLLNICESGQPVTLVHPTMGRISNVSCIAPAEFHERKDLGRVIQFRLTLMKGGARVYPRATADTLATVNTSALSAMLGALQDFARKVASVISLGVSIVNQAVATVRKWCAIVQSVIADVKAIIGAVSSLSGNYGRYASGANAGYSTSNRKAASAATVSSLLASAVTQRTAVLTASSGLISAASAVGNATAFATAVKAVAEAVAASANDPADAVRMLSALANFYPSAPTTASVIGGGMSTMHVAVGEIVRRTVIAQAAIASTSYQPSSSTDAASLRDSIISLIDDEIETAGDGGDDGTYAAFRALRVAVVADLNARGANLPSLTKFTFSTSLPALALASRMYRDSGRSDEIIAEANPIHPAFMPSSFDALSA
ncbi:TPA: DNA circularization protein [Burkholderia contaminans]|uniref:DNA circularization protein n=1 Tax=Burkholderia contaminans TaxID=488447 RepID=UPI000D0054F6|nr:DNA circularization N-terminal domain-containing protein [Burkholderia contaminans]HDR9065475.1 DNA circularization N-terminal domain-containing protein [Burkholderia vietnamiensis]MBM6427914.1 DNA circularization N-terminal domain-containing protein [Burkholderia contaminans]MCA7876745.1 DNA circularization N-terminal domain-containing protein [Burkholderia contaminans]MDN8024232.1 DNA circularization N-terminal domain-containing protein [Burkholderia contaminans]PRG14362.1 DNA circulation